MSSDVAKDSEIHSNSLRKVSSRETNKSISRSENIKCKIKLDEVNLENLHEREELLKNHEALCELTDNLLQKVLSSDQFLSDISYDITHEEVLAQVSVAVPLRAASL